MPLMAERFEGRSFLNIGTTCGCEGGFQNKIEGWTCDGNMRKSMPVYSCVVMVNLLLLFSCRVFHR